MSMLWAFIIVIKHIPKPWSPLLMYTLNTFTTVSKRLILNVFYMLQAHNFTGGIFADRFASSMSEFIRI